jgi:hypothetical protein
VNTGPIFEDPMVFNSPPMKILRSQLFTLLFLTLIISGCKKNISINEKQSILFQVDYVNYAWGYQHNGIIIDNEGNVLSYKNPQSWNFTDNELNITEAQVRENMAICLNSVKKISSDELNKYAGYIKNISSSKVTAPKNVAADAGSLVYTCYQYSEKSGTYKGSIIKTEGDFTSENLNFYSKKVTAWLKSIYDNTEKK